MRPLRPAALAALALALPAALTACGESEPTGSTSTASADVSASPVAALGSLEGEQTEVIVDQSFADALAALGVTAGFLGEATVDGATAAFPITGGSATYYDPSSGVRPYVTGMIEHDGSGLSLTAGGTTVELEDFVVDPGRSVLTATVSSGRDGQSTIADSANLFFLDGRTLQPLRLEGDTAVLEGTTVKLHPDAAQLLRQTFGTEEIPDYLEVGVARITLALPPQA